MLHVKEIKVLRQANASLVSAGAMIFEDHLKVPLIMPLRAGQQQLGNVTCFGIRA